MAKNDSVAVFPLYISDDKGKAANTTFSPSGGMSLRDYFAAKAMQAGMSIPVNAAPDAFASACYEMADAMLKARIK